MSYCRTCCDNAVVERFINLLKRERPSGEKNTKNAKQLGAKKFRNGMLSTIAFQQQKKLKLLGSG